MPRSLLVFVRYVDAANRRIGRFAMLLIFAMIGVLLYAALSRTLLDAPLIWAVEVAQMLMAAYYLLGGAYSVQLHSHVRMDLLYGRLSARGKAIADFSTAFLVLFYLVILLYGGVSSTQYALEYGQKNYSVWAPPMAPIKIIMTFGIVMMLLQIIAVFIKDMARAFDVSPDAETDAKPTAETI